MLYVDDMLEENRMEKERLYGFESGNRYMQTLWSSLHINSRKKQYALLSVLFLPPL